MRGAEVAMGEHRKVAANKAANKNVAFHMRVLIRSAGVALLGIVAAALSALTSTISRVFTPAAATYIVGGTQFAPPFCVPFCGTLATPQQNIDLATPYVNFFVPSTQNPGNP